MKQIFYTIIGSLLAFFMFYFYSFLSAEANLIAAYEGFEFSPYKIPHSINLSLDKWEKAASKYFISDFEIKSYIFKKTTSKNINIKKDGKIVITLKNKQRYDDKFSYYGYNYQSKISVKNFAITNIRDNKKQEIYKLYKKEINKNRDIICSFEVKKGDIINVSFNSNLMLELKDILPFILTAFFVLIVSFLCFCGKLREIDIIEKIKNLYIEINPVYKKTFFILFIVLNVVFLTYSTNFLIGNRDYDAAYKGIEFSFNFYNGRYFGHFFKTLVTDGKIVPVLTSILTFFFISLGAVLISIYWNLKKTFPIFITTGLLFCVQPFIVERLYYVHELPEKFIAPVLIVLAFMIAEKYCDIKDKRFFLYNLVSIIFLNVSLAIYPATITTMAVLFTGKFFINSLGEEIFNKETLKNVLLKNIHTIGDIICAGIIFKLVLLNFKHNGILANQYTVRSLNIHDLPERIIDCLQASFYQLINYQFPFTPNSITILFTILLIVLVFMIISSQSNIKTKCIRLLFLFLALFATKTTVMISESQMLFMTRIDTFGLLYFRVLIIAAIFYFTDKKSYLNFTYIISALIIAICIINDFEAQRVWKLASESEKMFWNRVIMRLEEKSEFNPYKKYIFIQIGETYPMREKYYKTKIKTQDSPGSYSDTYNPNWRSFLAPSYYHQNNIIKYGINFLYGGLNRTTDKNEKYIYNKCLKKLKENGITDKLEEWPKENSIMIYDDIIAFVTDEKVLKKAVKRFNNKSSEQKFAISRT